MAALPFRDREDAARQLAAALDEYRGTNPVVLAIPRGAVPMGRVLADALGGELDVVLVRKLGAPMNPELAIGAIDEQGTVMLAEHAPWTGATDAFVEREAARQLQRIRDRRASYRPGQPPIALAGRTVIVVDDGLGTGWTRAGALRAVGVQGPAQVVCAVPVAARESLARVSRYADDVVCLATPHPFNAVSLYYRHFEADTDDEVIGVLAAPARTRAQALEGGVSTDTAAPQVLDVQIPAGRVTLDGDLTLPRAPHGLVVFAHGSGSSRHSRRNRQVAGALNARGLATLLFDLLTEDEDVDRAARFDIRLLARRLEAALDWVAGESACRDLPLGLFGSSTGAAAALVVAAQRADRVAGVVSRGGRPDLAGAQSLADLRVPTLLIVGGADEQVLELNRAARAAMTVDAELVVVPGATHLFEEPGALEHVADVAGDWLLRTLDRAGRLARPGHGVDRG